MQLLSTVREARDHFLDEMSRYGVAPEMVDFHSDAARNDCGVPTMMPNVSTTGWCVIPQWIEPSLNGPLRPRSEFCAVLDSADRDSRLVIEYGDAFVVTPHGVIYPLIQPSALGDIPAPREPAVFVDIDHCDDEGLIAALQWGADFLACSAIERESETAFAADAVPELMSAVQSLNIAPSLHQFHYCIAGAHPQIPGGRVQFCEIRQQTFTRLPAAGLPPVEGWVVKQRRPEGAYIPEFVVTPAGAILCLDLDLVHPEEVVMPEPLQWPPDDVDDFDAAVFLGALEDTLQWLPLEYAIQGPSRDVDRSR